MRTGKPALIHTAEKDMTCSACGELIPMGDRYWVRPGKGSGEHTNCELYSDHYIRNQILQEKVNGHH